MILASEPYRWTAVVRGATLCGVEHSQAVDSMIGAKKHYGTVNMEKPSAIKNQNQADMFKDPITGKWIVRGQMNWLISKGDLILPDEPRTVMQRFFYKFMENSVRKGELPVYSWSKDKAPERLMNIVNGKH
jgi:hypothetical protein